MLTAEQIKDILDNVEDLSPKCFAIIITDMAERIDQLEYRYAFLETEYANLKKNYVKLHLNSMYGLMATESKGEQN